MSSAALALQPGASDLESEEPPPLSELHRFLDRVIADGRYVLDFQKDPSATARALGFELSPEVSEEIAATPRAKLFRELYVTKFAHPTMRAAWPALAVGIVIVVGVIIIIIGVTIAIVTRRGEKGGSPTKFVIDRSAHRELKV
jgi:hypothetical protein